ncbi:MAG: type II toxin-antitoxin system VapC family toxin [Alphaproteobacteria bacterium]|nr:type II toxin-antitoxin system VapC family toxin [Alphaproteobacteria bacterium]MCY3755838.1 type II toxin-antitoxin system VapC family toxin [Alphaproteobacteria bacterium]MYE58923.1 type II toxin-antitoxin system VapC family toxin [Alphaproteobacteria bacterium]
MILLDTHAFVWTVGGDRRLGPRARAAIEEAASGEGVLVSAITPWEVALLVGKGRLRLGREVGAWLEAALALPGMVLAPIEPAIAVDSTRLPGDFHADPADRLIVATSRHRGVPLLTADRAILSYAANGYLHALDAAA